MDEKVTFVASFSLTLVASNDLSINWTSRRAKEKEEKWPSLTEMATNISSHSSRWWILNSKMWKNGSHKNQVQNRVANVPLYNPDGSFGTKINRPRSSS